MKAKPISRWYLLLFVVLALGGMLRFIGYNFQLPFRFIAEYDEAHLFADTLVHRGVLENTALMWPGYPPGIFLVDGAAQLMSEKLSGQTFWDASNTAVAIIRVWSIVAGIITALIIALLTRELAGKFTALFVAAIWLVQPNPNFQTVREMPMAWVLLFATLSLYLAVTALTRNSRWLAVASVLAGLMAVTFRYSEVIVLVPAVFVALWNARKEGRKWILALLVQAVIILLYFGIGWAVYGHSYSTAESTHVGAGIAGLFDWSAQRPILDAAISQIGLSTPIFIVIFGVGTIIFGYSYRLGTRTIAWVFCAGYGIFSAIFIEVYLNYSVLIPRYITPVSVPFTILIGVGLVKIIAWLDKRTAQKWIGRTLLVVTAVFWLIPLLTQSIQLDLNRLRPDTHGALINWAATNLDQGSVLVDGDNSYTFSKIYGGYTGSYRVYIRADLTSHTLAQWRDESVNYAVFSENVVDQLRVSAPTYISKMLLINQFPPIGSPENWQNSPEYVFRLTGIQYPRTEAFVNGITFKGYDINRKIIQRGEDIQLTLYWNAAQKPTDNYNVYMHLVSLNDATKLVAQVDGAPAGISRPTLSWTNPSEILISPTFRLMIAESTKPGCYHLIAGLYNYETGQRLPFSNGQAAMSLTSICMNAAEF